MKPCVSVIIPVYNRELEIIRAINSVLNQTVIDFELLVIDDGSNDGTRSSVEAFESEHIRYIYKENGGVSSARNLGLDEAKGEFIAFLDSDDEWEPMFLELCVKELRENPDVTVAYGRDKMLNRNGRVKRIREVQKCKSGKIFADLFESFYALVPCSMIRRSGLNDLRFDDSMRQLEDVCFFLRLAMLEKFLFVPGVFLLRHDSKVSLSKMGSGLERLALLESFYFEKGGDRHITRNRAFKKLAKVALSQGKRCEINGEKKQARAFYLKGICYNPFNLKCINRYVSGIF